MIPVQDINEQLRTAIESLTVAEDPWMGAIRVLANCRERNLRAGGDDDLFCAIITAQAVLLTLPIASGTEQ